MPARNLLAGGHEAAHVRGLRRPGRSSAASFGGNDRWRSRGGLVLAAHERGTPDFRDHPAVINGCSELFAEVFGNENGIGARSAVGMGSLPGNIAVEIEAIFEINSA